MGRVLGTGLSGSGIRNFTLLQDNNNNNNNNNKNDDFYSAVTWRKAITRALTYAKR